ncbi:MAG TPA: class I SAM-dependent methyltransferase [Anaerolineaceae bacterium]
MDFPRLKVLASTDWDCYELLDSGGGQRLERFGKYTLVRPEAEAVWQPALPERSWQKADAFFQVSNEENGGHWVFRHPAEPRWQMEYKGIKFWVQPSASRHLGVFPEQAAQWDWIETQLRQVSHPVKVLNLFGYTGLASLAAARGGAQVTHVDASKKVITWGRENQAASGLDTLPIRWIVDDALKFIQREVRRGSFYDGLILDPPKFGRGPRGEVWEFYKLLPNLLQACRQVLTREPLFVMLTAYAVKASSLTLMAALNEMLMEKKGRTEAGEIVLVEKSAGRLLPTSIYASWSSLMD